MEYLLEAEAEKATGWINKAIKQARNSKCQKSQRGVVIVKDDVIIGNGCNNPPLGMECDGENCYNICSQYCVHAEQNAILDALGNGSDLSGSRMYHIKIKYGEVRPSGDPSCVECSKLVLQSGIAEFVLSHERGYGLYSAQEFHELSLISLQK